MKHTERFAPAAAVLSAALSIACCLPLGIPAAVGLAGLGLFAQRFQTWFTAAALVLLAAGLVQLLRRPSCERRSRVSIGVFGVGACVVIGLAAFPQSFAGFLADLGSSARTPLGVPLTALDAGTWPELREQFNRAADQVRVVLLLSPT